MFQTKLWRFYLSETENLIFFLYQKYINNSLLNGCWSLLGIKRFLKNGAKTFLDMFPEVNSFPWGNCELQRTDNVCGCKYLSMLSAKWRLLCLLFFKHLFQCVEQNVYKLLLVWNESWLLRATFCMNKKMEEKKNKLKTCHHEGSIQSPFTWEKNRSPLCQVCRA